MVDEVEILVELLSDVLGKPKNHYETKFQITFNCPRCSEEKGLDNGDGKGNFEVNYEKHVYHCWACGETYGTHGPLGKLFDQFGTKKQKKVYELIKPENLKKEDKKKDSLRLPDGFTKFKDSNPRFIPHIEAYKYLISRGITDEMIENYNIGYTVVGDFSYKVIIPSYNNEGVLNYFVARSWSKSVRAKYKNPTAEKDQIIFWENRINWENDIYICEGVFDGFFLSNPIVMLGKQMSELLFQTIYEKSQKNVVICLDGDAWSNALKLYNTLNGGRLYNKIKIIKPPKDMDVADLRGNIDEYYYEIK